MFDLSRNRGQGDDNTEQIIHMAGLVERDIQESTVVAVRDIKYIAILNCIFIIQLNSWTDHVVESEARFRAAFELAAVGIAHVAPDGHFIFINRKLCDMVGYSHNEMLGLTFQDITYPDDLDIDIEQANKLLAGKSGTYSIEKRYIRENCDLVWIHLTVSLVKNEAGQPQWFVSVVKDISERKLAEEKLHASEEKFRNLVEQSPVAIEILDYDGKINFVNSAFMKLWGITQDTLSQVYEKYNFLQDEQARKLGVIPSVEAVILLSIEYNVLDTMKTFDYTARPLAATKKDSFYSIKKYSSTP